MKELYFSRITTQGWVKYIEVSLESDNFRTLSRIRWNYGKIAEILMEEKVEVDFFSYHSYLIGRINKYKEANIVPKQPCEESVLEILLKFFKETAAIVYSTDPVKQKQMELHSAQSGIDTPGCSCNHNGMGAGWHGSECDWIKNAQ